jgi:hypothetical protein
MQAYQYKDLVYTCSPGADHPCIDSEHNLSTVIRSDHGDLRRNPVARLESCRALAGWGRWVWEAWSGGSVKLCSADGFAALSAIHFGR